VEYLDIYDTVTGEVASREATLLLKDEKLGVVYPEEFLPVARQCNKMEELGKLLLGTAFRDFGENRDQDPTAKRLNVNLFSVFLAEEDLGSLLRAECRENNVRPEDVTIEITESDAADNRETVKSAISELRKMGFKVALDDYGAGYSNIQEMFMLPFDEVKLSGGLLAEAGKNAVSDAVLESNVAMLRRMGFPIMAEGVDTEEQARIVKKLSVDFYQRTYQGGAA
jgi:EAL domain-containing protein (putative c-di-GMP-specific phosphodiesterase class I)